METGLAYFSLGILILYVPLETYVSWDGLLQPTYLTGYLVDVIAFVLLFYGGIHSLKQRPRFAIAPLCAAWGFCACLGWRSYFGRVSSRIRGLNVYENQDPKLEMAVGAAMIIAFTTLVLCLYVAHRQAKLTSGKKNGSAE